MAKAKPAIKRDISTSMITTEIIDDVADIVYGIWAVGKYDGIWRVVCQDTVYQSPDYGTLGKKSEAQFWALYYALRYPTYKEWRDTHFKTRIIERGKLNNICDSAKTWILRLCIKRMTKELKRREKENGKN